MLKYVKTNDLKKGTRVFLRNGWEADIADNAKGDTRICTVYGFCTEMGSVYSHDIMGAIVDGQRVLVEHTEKQLKCKKWSDALFAKHSSY